MLCYYRFASVNTTFVTAICTLLYHITITPQPHSRTVISVYQRTRPRGDWKNVKMTGVAAESARGFIKGVMSFKQRKQWEGLFEDGLAVEAIDIGEGPCAVLFDESETATNPAKSSGTSGKGVSSTPKKGFIRSMFGGRGNNNSNNSSNSNSSSGSGNSDGNGSSSPAKQQQSTAILIPPLTTTTSAAASATSPSFSSLSPSPSPSSPSPLPSLMALPEGQTAKSGLARTTDDVVTFLQTVDTAGVPEGMVRIAFLIS
jgi:hypothetical protein